MNNLRDHLQAIVDIADARLRDKSIDAHTSADLTQIVQSATAASECVGVLLHHAAPADKRGCGRPGCTQCDLTAHT